MTITGHTLAKVILLCILFYLYERYKLFFARNNITLPPNHPDSEPFIFRLGILTIKFIFILVLSAFASFCLAIVLDQLKQTGLGAQARLLGSTILLCSFFLLLISGLWLIFKATLASLIGYFSVRRRMERKLLFYISKRNNLDRQFSFKKDRLLYINQQKRKHLLKKYNQRSVTS